jgi:plasmid maintenance system antidote protein VapI
MASKKIDPVHPGEILLKEFIEPMGFSQNRLVLALVRELGS